MADQSRPPRPKPTRPSQGRPSSPGPRKPAAARRRAEGGKPKKGPISKKKLAPFNPKVKPQPRSPRPAREDPGEGPDEPLLIQIQVRPPRKAPAGSTDGPATQPGDSGPKPRKPAVSRPQGRSEPSERREVKPKRPGVVSKRPYSSVLDRGTASKRPPSGRAHDRFEGGASERPPRKPYGRSSRPPAPAARPERKPYDRASNGVFERPARKTSGEPSEDRSGRPAGERSGFRKSYEGRNASPGYDRLGSRKPYEARPRGPSTDRPAPRRHEDRSGGPSTDRPAPRKHEGRPGGPAGRPASRAAPAGKKFDEKRPRDTRVAPPKGEPKRRLTADESFGLPKSWITEIQETARAGKAPQVAEAVSKALEYFAEEEYEDAARFAEDAKRNAPRSPQVSELLGLALYHTGQWKEALSELLHFRRLTSSVEQNHVIADLYRALGRSDRALETTAEVSQSDVPPEIWVETMIVAAGALADQGDVDRAITMLARGDPGSGAVEPYFLRHWYVRADLLEKAGRREEARNVWRRIVAEDPDFFDAEERLSAL